MTTSSNLKTQVTDASVQVEDSSFPSMLQPSVVDIDTQLKSVSLNEKSGKLPFPVAAMNPALMTHTVPRKRGRPRKVPLPLQIANSANSLNGAKERNVINVEESSKSSHFPSTMNLGANSEIVHTPRKRGRPRKIFINKPVVKEMLTDNLMVKTNQVNSGIADANKANGEQTLIQKPEKRKRGRPPKNKTPQVLHQSIISQEEKQCVEVSALTPVSDPISPDGSSTPKRYSTRGKKIDLSFLTGKNKKEDVDKLETEDGLVCFKKTKVESSPHVLLQNSTVNVKRDLFEKDDSHQSEVDEDNDFVVSGTDGNSASKSQFKKNKSRVLQPLVMSDVALLPTIRVEITQKRGHKKMTGIKNKGIRTLVKSTALSAAAAQAPEKALLTSSGETSSSLDDGTATSEGSDLKLTSGVDAEGLRCHLCKIKSERFDEITDHLKIVHGIEKPLRCDVCERTFEKLFDLRSHVNRKHGPFPQMDTVSCFKCGKIFQGTAKLNWHLSFIHKITREPTPKKTLWPCNQCNDSKLCNLCGKVFSKGNHLVTHIQAVHTKEKAAQCTICSKKFNHIRYLRTHMKRHEGIKKHECPTCGWRFFESNTLKDHMETHKEASKRRYRFTCEYCGQKYISKANFSDHLNKHTGEKPHKCQICGKGFAFRTMLMKHQIHIHTTEKPFKCTYCERAFKFKAKLLQHTVIHTGVSKYVCQSCNKPFSCAATLKHHQPRCRGNTNWQQNKTLANESLTLMVDDLALEQPQQQQQQQQQEPQETSDTVEIPVEDQSDIVIDMSGLPGIPEGSILQAAAQAAQLMEIPEVFMCSECNAVFGSLPEAEEHVASFHTDVVAVASTGVGEGAANEIKVMEEPASSDFIDAAMTAESGST